MPAPIQRLDDEAAAIGFDDDRSELERRQDEIDAAREQDHWDAIRKGEEPREWNGADRDFGDDE